MWGMQWAQTENFLNRCITVAVDLREPPLDVRKRLDPTHVENHYYTVRAAIETEAKKTRKFHLQIHKMGEACGSVRLYQIK